MTARFLLDRAGLGGGSRELSQRLSSCFGDRELEGFDLLRRDADGLIADLTVMIRPLSGLIAPAQAIGRKVDAAGLATSRDEPA